MASALQERGWHTGTAARGLVDSMGLSIAAFADAMQLSRATAYNRFRMSEWPFPEVERAASVLGVEVRWLDTGEGPKLSEHAAARLLDPAVQRAMADMLADMRAKLLAFTELVMATAVRADASGSRSGQASPLESDGREIVGRASGD